MARRVARVFYEHLSPRRTGVSPGRRRRVIPAYICAASIWTYDGNNLEALGARRTCKPTARVRNHQYRGCAQGATAAVSAGTNTTACVLRVEGAKPQ